MKLGDTAFFEKCETCKKKRLYTSKRMIRLPVGGEAKSQKLMCGKCYKAVFSMLKSTKV